MQLGLVGLGKMGFNMRERLREGGHEVIGYDPRPEVTDVPTLAALAEALDAPRTVWVMVPSGPITDETIKSLAGVLSAGDLVIDGGNSRYTEDGPHAKLLGDKGIEFIDAGVSGGIWGLTEGYGLMVGGSDADIERAMPIFDTLRPPGQREDGFVHAGPVGAGHYAKMVHNGIEYALMTAYAEGYEIVGGRGSDRGRPGRLSRRGPTARWCGPGCSSCWPRRSRRIRNFDGHHRLHRGLRRRPVDGGGGHRLPRPGARSSRRRCSPGSLSRQDDSPTMKAVSALRNQFGGHAVKRISESG